MASIEPGFEWDEDKRLSNLAKHGIDFEEAIEIFDGRITVTKRSTFPAELRLLTIGRRDIDTITVVWTRRGPARRIISARRARKNEIDLLKQREASEGSLT